MLVNMDARYHDVIGRKLVAFESLFVTTHVGKAVSVVAMNK